MLSLRPAAAAPDFAPIVLRARPPAPLLDALALAAPGWPVAVAAGGIPVAPLGTGFRVIDAGTVHRAEDAWEAAHWVLNAAIAAYAEAVAGTVVLHAGAALAGPGALVFAGESHAGKSAIALHLARPGRTLLGDDRLLVATRARHPLATALGLARKRNEVAGLLGRTKLNPVQAGERRTCSQPLAATVVRTSNTGSRCCLCS